MQRRKIFRHCVKHIVPVVCKEVENHHFDHEYVIEKKVIKENNRYDHGRRNEDWCKLFPGCGCGVNVNANANVKTIVTTKI